MLIGVVVQRKEVSWLSYELLANVLQILGCIAAKTVQSV